MTATEQLDEPEERSLVDELMALDPSNANVWDGPLWITGSVAHCYRDCRDMRQTAHVGGGIDPHKQRRHGPNACKYCLTRSETNR